MNDYYVIYQYLGSKNQVLKLDIKKISRSKAPIIGEEEHGAGWRKRVTGVCEVTFADGVTEKLEETFESKDFAMIEFIRNNINHI